ncbi:alpha/beta fold hydrolase [Glycomyces rhizosphaerae]|uniref:Alpha/beta fold hydrolase n=1 Tax=Glycomyces rhizosphaerae TaxID=2054422 RepID=A0ABV7Q438_9ACTN
MLHRNESATFVLIHGGGSTSWDWHLVAPVLRELGHDVVAVDLPIEDDANGISELADAVVEACGDRTDLAIVAHSWGGLVAPVVAARVPAELLVFVSALIPKPGEAPNAWWSASGYNDLGISFETEEKEIELFYNGVPADLITASYATARDQSWARGDEPTPLKAWPEVPTRFLLCRDDRFMPPEFARAQVRDRLGITPDEIDGGHMVALSRPRELAERLHRLWTEPRRETDPA